MKPSQMFIEAICIYYNIYCREALLQKRINAPKTNCHCSLFLLVPPALPSRPTRGQWRLGRFNRVTGWKRLVSTVICIIQTLLVSHIFRIACRLQGTMQYKILTNVYFSIRLCFYWTALLRLLPVSLRHGLG